MANWYISSTAYAAISAWAASHAYSIGDIIRPTAAAEGRKQVYRCTTAGTSASTEPTWTAIFSSTTTSGTAVFTPIGNDTYGWSAALGDIKTALCVNTSGYGAVGDTFLIASDHTETLTTAYVFGSNLGGSWTAATTHFLSVNRAGSVPPVAADITAGAAISVSFTNWTFDIPGPTRFEGITFAHGGTGTLTFNSGTHTSYYFKSCVLKITGTTNTQRITTGNPASIVLDNTSLSFGNASQGVTTTYALDLLWINTATPISGGTSPTALFLGGTTGTNLFTCRGVDFSAYTGTLYSSSSGGTSKVLLDGCKIGSMTLASLTATINPAAVVEIVNCDDGTTIRNERLLTAGSVTTERTIVLSGGATDDIGSFSLKLATGSSHLDKYVDPLESFWFDVENTTTGTSKTATVEIVSSGTLNNDEIWLELDYMGTAGTSLVSTSTTLPATVLTAASAVPTSTATWASSPATPAYQKLQVTFTPQRAGRMRGRVLLGKASTTVYVNPVITIT